MHGISRRKLFSTITNAASGRQQKNFLLLSGSGRQQKPSDFMPYKIIILLKFFLNPLYYLWKTYNFALQIDVLET